jgi:hypothetical protein
MPIQTTWTAIPNGIKDGKLRIAAMASIKLTSPSTNETTLGAGFSPMLSWHQRKFTFTVTFAGAMGVKTFQVGPLSASSQAAWPALFKAETPVRPFQAKIPVKAWESYSVTRILDQTKTSYAAVAVQSVNPKYVGVTDLIKGPFRAPDIYRSPFLNDRGLIPDLGGRGGIRPDLGGPGGLVRPPAEDDEDFPAELITATDFGTGLYGSAREMLKEAYSAACHEWRNEGGELPEDEALWWEARQFFEAYDAHEEADEQQPRVGTRPQAPGVAQPVLQTSKYKNPYAGKPLAVTPPKLDFHEALGLLGDHPALMRQLGLIFDLEVPLASAGLAPTGSVTLSVASDGAGAAGENPLTSFQFNAAQNVFLPNHKPGGEYSRGFYNLGPDYVQITGVDVDSLAIRVLDFATTIRGQFALHARTSLGAVMGSLGPPTPPPLTPRPPAGGTPSTRPSGGAATRPGAGVGAVRPGQGVRVQPGVGVPRVDQQLMLSEALFQKMGDRPDTAAPPGLRSAGVSIARKDRSMKLKSMVDLAASNLGKLNSPKSVLLYFDDMIRGYRMDVFANGKWHTLCARQGGYTLPGNVPGPTVDEESWVSSSVSSDPSATDPANPKGKVHEVMLRWHGYSLVAQRPSKTLDQANNLTEGGTSVDQRFPVRMQFAARSGSLPILRFGRKYRFRVRLATVAGTGPELDAASPGNPYETPELTYRRWESVPSPTLYEHAQTKEGESASHLVIRKFVSAPTSIEPAMRQLVPPAGDVSLAETHGMFDKNGKPDPAMYAKIQERDNMQPLGKYVGGRVSRLPYFADPLAAGVTVQTAPHVATPLSLSYPGAWPEQQSLQLEVRPGSGASTATGDRFVLNLLPGEIAFPKISSTVAPANADLFGLMDWLTPAQKASLSAYIPQGRLWTVTPFREVTAVFATQVPEQKASVDRQSVSRIEGSTSASVRGRVQTHSWTTASVDFEATWTDQVDHLEEPKRTTQTEDKKGTGFKLKIVRGPTAPVVFQPFAEDHEFGDTKHHEVTYTLVAHSPFKQYFPPQWPLAENPQATRFTETAENALKFHIPASRRPDPPLIEYVIPTFGWNRAASATALTSVRQGNGLRVYLRRPWFSSGNDEQLGVVLLSPKTGSASEKLEANTTKLGADPVFKHGDVPAVVTPALFGGAGPAAGPFSAPEIPEANATVVPYPVSFDEEKQMWYADVTVNPGTAYTPFVRLALARYQPYSAGLHLSLIQVADIVQLQANRSATVTFNDAARKIKVAVVGAIGESAYGPNRLYGTLEEKVGSDEDTGWRAVLENGKELTRTIPISPPSLIAVPVSPGVRPPGVIRPPGVVRPPEEESEAFDGEDQATRPQVRPPTQPQVRPPAIRDLTPAQPGEGEFTLPKPRNQAQYRLVIREYEVFDSDTMEPDLPEVPASRPLEDRDAAMIKPKPGARLVYLDAIPLG